MWTRSSSWMLIAQALLVTLGIWAAVIPGVITQATGSWLTLAVVTAALLLIKMRAQAALPQSMNQILYDLENPKPPSR